MERATFSIDELMKMTTHAALSDGNDWAAETSYETLGDISKALFGMKNPNPKRYFILYNPGEMTEEEFFASHGVKCDNGKVYDRGIDLGLPAWVPVYKCTMLTEGDVRVYEDRRPSHGS
jgi:hypothetical protein